MEIILRSDYTFIPLQRVEITIDEQGQAEPIEIMPGHYQVLYQRQVKDVEDSKTVAVATTSLVIV